MGAPNLSFTFTRGKISDEPGFDCIAVTFSADAPYQAFECRATKAGESSVSYTHLTLPTKLEV